MSESAYNKCLKVSVGAICLENGFTHCDEPAVDLLTSIMQEYITRVGHLTQQYCELASRTQPILHDVGLALIDIGAAIESLPPYAKRPNKTAVIPPAVNPAQAPPRVLQVGHKRNLPSYIPDYFPAFPDQHTYIKTEARKSLPNDYQSIREKAASQKRDVERALTKFIAKTGETESLFSDDPYAYPLIANKPKPLPYLDALLPKDKDLEVTEEEVKPEKVEPEDAENKAVESAAMANGAPTAEAKLSTQLSQDGSTVQPSSADLQDSDSNLDNPYLRPIKMPKLLKTTVKKPRW